MRVNPPQRLAAWRRDTDAAELGAYRVGRAAQPLADHIGVDAVTAPVDGALEVLDRPAARAGLAQRPVVRGAQAKPDQVGVQHQAGKAEVEAERLDAEAGADHAGQHAVEGGGEGGERREQQAGTRIRGLFEWPGDGCTDRHGPLRNVIRREIIASHRICPLNSVDIFLQPAWKRRDGWSQTKNSFARRSKPALSVTRLCMWCRRSASSDCLRESASEARSRAATRLAIPEPVRESRLLSGSRSRGPTCKHSAILAKFFKVRLAPLLSMV